MKIFKVFIMGLALASLVFSIYLNSTAKDAMVKMDALYYMGLAIFNYITYTNIKS